MKFFELKTKNKDQRCIFEKTDIPSPNYHMKKSEIMDYCYIFTDFSSSYSDN